MLDWTVLVLRLVVLIESDPGWGTGSYAEGVGFLGILALTKCHIR